MSALPRLVTVSSIVSSRYSENRRPQSWDERTPGVDVIRDSSGSELRIVSDGQQSPPQPGWVIQLLGGDHTAGYRWTLFGIPRGAGVVS